MIVQKNSDFRNILRHAFEVRGYLTWTCPAVEFAHSIFTAVQPNIVILDVEWEDADPVELANRWKEMSPDTKVIMVHAHSVAPLADLLEDIKPAA